MSSLIKFKPSLLFIAVVIFPQQNNRTNFFQAVEKVTYTQISDSSAAAKSCVKCVYSFFLGVSKQQRRIPVCVSIWSAPLLFVLY